MNKYFKKLIFIIGCVLFFPLLALAANSGNSDGFAWSELGGWIHFSGEDAGVDYGMVVTNDQITGYIWSEKLGWISLNCMNRYVCSAVPYGVVSDGQGNLSGYAWSELGGWINFSGIGSIEYQVEINSSGGLSGYVWSEKLGWVNMNDSGSYYSVTTGNLAAYCAECEPCNPPVLYWGFDSGYGTVAYDESLRGNSIRSDGTINNAVWQEEGLCLAGKCLYFDGNNDYVSRAYDTDLDMKDHSFSVGAWFRAAPQSAYSILAARYNAGGWKLWLTAAGELCFGIDDDSTWSGESPDDKACTSGGKYDDNEWHYVMGTKIDTSSLKIYVDGLEKGADNTTIADGYLSGTSPVLYVGIDSDGASSDFNGFLDELKIYNYARSASQVRGDYAAGLAGVRTKTGISASFGGSSDKWLSDGLVGYWKMDEAVGTWNGTAGEVTDASGNGNNGTADGNASTTAGKFGNSGVFNGVGASLDMLGTDELDGMSELTISAWVYRNDNAATYAILGKNSGYVIRINSGYVYAALANDSGWQSSCYGDALLPSGEWMHITMVYDGQKIRHYYNGSDGGSCDYAIGSIVDNTAYIEIGESGWSTNYWKGRIDEVRIYNRALEPREVLDLYEWSAPPLVHLKMDEKNGDTAYDTSGNGYDGVFVTEATSPVWDTGKFGSGLRFDGSDDYVSLGDLTDFEVEPGDAMTVSAWFRAGPLSQNGAILYKSGNCKGLNTRLETDGDLYIGFNVGVSCADYTSTYITDNSRNYDDNKWHFIAGVIDRINNTLILYVDGRRFNSAVLPATGADLNNSSFRIGTNWDHSNAFKGWIDDVRIYDYVRTEKQIIEDMNASHPAGGSPVGSQLVYYKFDKGYGATAHDASPNGFNGTLNGGYTWSPEGKFGRAIELNGSTGYVEIPGDLGDPDEMTISLWFKTTNHNNGADYIMDGRNGGNWWWLQDYVSGVCTDSAGNICFEGRAEIPSTYLSSNEWYYVAVTENASAVKLYLNGELIDTGTGEDPDLGANVRIGRRYDAGGEFDGSFDEVKIYNYVLNDDEIKLDYNQGKSVILGSVSTSTAGVASSPNFAASGYYCVPGSTDYCAPPVMELKLDEKAGATVYDSSGGSASGAFANSPVWRRGKLGSALEFDDSSSQRVDLSSVGSIAAPYTVVFWFNPQELGRTQTIFNLDGSNSYPSYNLQSNNRLLIYSGAEKYLYNSHVFTSSDLNKWWQAALYVDSSSSLTGWKIYLNGIEDTGSTGLNTGTYYDPSSAGNIGSNDTSNYFDGLIDHVLVYNYRRTPAQIAWDYNHGAPIAHYKFDECSGGIIHDNTENRNDGTLYLGSSGNTVTGTCATSSGSFWYEGRDGVINSAGSFDGTDDYVDTSMNPPANITFSAWFYYSGDDSSNHIAAFESVPTAKSSLSIQGDQIIFINNSSYIYYDAKISKNVWYHIVLIADETDITNTEVYINGREVSAGTTVNSTESAFNDLQIGRGEDWSSNVEYFDGLIDEVKVWNYTLTAEQVKIEYNQGSVRFGG